MDQRPSDDWSRGKNLGETEGRPPNIILILPDQQRFDSLGCYGNRNAISPHIDRLASEGACFESAFVTPASLFRGPIFNPNGTISPQD